MDYRIYHDFVTRGFIARRHNTGSNSSPVYDKITMFEYGRGINLIQRVSVNWVSGEITIIVGGFLIQDLHDRLSEYRRVQIINR